MQPQGQHARVTGTPLGAQLSKRALSNLQHGFPRHALQPPTLSVASPARNALSERGLTSTQLQPT